jgi:hypothetical protein
MRNWALQLKVLTGATQECPVRYLQHGISVEIVVVERICMTIDIAKATCFIFLRVMKTAGPVHSYITFVSTETGSTLYRTHER